MADHDTRPPQDTDSLVLERFAEIVYAALCEVGLGDVFVPAFLNDDGSPYLEFDTDDYPESSDEFRYLCQAERLAQAAVGYPQFKVEQ